MAERPTHKYPPSNLRGHNIRWLFYPIRDPHHTQYLVCQPISMMPSPVTLIVFPRNCLHDPTVYTEPDRFLPDRFMRDGQLDPNVRDPAKYAFGYGRRSVRVPSTSIFKKACSIANRKALGYAPGSILHNTPCSSTLRSFYMYSTSPQPSTNTAILFTLNRR